MMWMTWTLITHQGLEMSMMSSLRTHIQPCMQGEQQYYHRKGSNQQSSLVTQQAIMHAVPETGEDVG